MQHAAEIGTLTLRPTLLTETPDPTLANRCGEERKAATQRSTRRRAQMNFLTPAYMRRVACGP
eukprot:scaffold129528_cov60-Phaeocystis_antarctica.AAC.1